MAHVINVKYSCNYDVYVGRPSRYGNIFRLGIDGNREEVLEQYEGWLWSQPNFVSEIRRELRGKILGCHCYPQLCHADVLARIANDWQLCMPLLLE